MFELSLVYEEVLRRSTKLLDGQNRVEYPEFMLMQESSLQVYSKRLGRIVLLYYTDLKQYRQIHHAIQVENDAETARLLGLMRSIMVLEDLADA